VRVLLAFDKFKGSLTAPAACELAARALRARHRGWQIDLCPLTDGGEGFAPILTRAAGGQTIPFKVMGPRGGLVDAHLGIVAGAKIPDPARELLQLPVRALRSLSTVAVIEMAAASGLHLLPKEQQDPWQTTTYGTGQLIRAAAELGAAAIVLGVGGSATIDLGLGALAALGLEFRSATTGKVRPPVPARWEDIVGLEGEVYRAIPPVCIACDVTNPLFGRNGAAAIYGPQKGLAPKDRPRFEAAMRRMARLLRRHCGGLRLASGARGAGAAGGFPFGLMVGAHARLVAGFALVSAWLDLPARVAAADIVITGEGRFDATSFSGKGPGAVAASARALGKAVHVFAGQLGAGVSAGGWRLHRITPPEFPLDQAQREAPELLAHAIRSAF
jgi:glycerate kinase